MVTFTIERLIPKFLLDDRNGFAMAKAIEAALNAMNSVMQQGVGTVLDVERMPQWRLDEMAWELACLYDYTAGVEDKRRWIREAVPLYSLHGTAQAIYNYLNGAFDAVDVEECWQYGGDPFHFRVTVDGDMTDEKNAWIHNAIRQAKNVRSVLDNIAVGTKTQVAIQADGDVLARICYPLAGDGSLAGTLP